MDTNNQSASAGMAFLQGAAIGAVVALLFAPQSGRELRKQLKKYGQRTGKRLQEMAAEGRETVEHTVQKGRQMAHEATKAAQNAIAREWREHRSS